jgi:uncharacterized protein
MELRDELATGYGGVDAIHQLWRAQDSRRLLLIKLFVNESGPDAEINAAVSAISEAEHCDPTARELLVEPMVSVWAAATIRKIAWGTVTVREKAHFAALAAAAALKAGSEAELIGHTRDGWLYLPTLGRVRVAADDQRVRLAVRNGRLWVNGTEVGSAEPAWQKRRRLTANHGNELGVFLEDLDPYRDAYHVPAAEWMPPGECAVWHQLLAETWSILTELAPSRAAEMAAGLHSLVPLTSDKPNAAHSATAREAVGVVGLDLPRSPADFAVALVHELQHSKLSALLDIVDLYDDTSDRTFFAPWRTDPRPVGGLFQGVYAFLGVADMWRVLSAQPDRFPTAQQEFAEARALVTDAIGALAGSGLLTGPGERFVDGMRAAVERLHATAVPAAQVAAAGHTLESRRAAWPHDN